MVKQSFIGVALLLAAALATVPQAAASPELGHQDGNDGCNAPLPSVPASDVTALIESGTPVVMDCVTIDGDLALSSMGTVAVPVVITNSEINGLVIAEHTTFAKTADFEGTRFLRSVDLSLAVFEGRADFSESFYNSEADFGNSAFRWDVRFERAEFKREADFEGISVGGIADFRRSRFHGAASFAGASFQGFADFQLGKFQFDGDGQTDFRGARFDDRASFVSATFKGRADFSDVSSKKDLVFDFAEFRQTADFMNAVTLGGLSLIGAAFEAEAIFDQAVIHEMAFYGAVVADISMCETTVEALVMDSAHVDAIRPRADRTRLLKVIERTARDKDDLGAANDALYKRRVLERQERHPIVGALELVFCGWGYGYGVRPLNVLTFLGGVLGIDLLLRFIQRGHFRWPMRHILRGAWYDVRTVASAWKIGWPSDFPDIIEWAAYKLLLASLLINLGNFSPAVREVVDAVL